MTQLSSSLPPWPPALWRRPEGNCLSRMEAALVALGNPHHRLPPVVHVAGTNGKGSTIAHMGAALEAAGYRVHRYTTPHLIRFHERIMLAGEEITEDYLNALVERCRAALPEAELEFFEGTTALAMLAFSEVPADVLLLEVGCGGSEDATNIIPNPALSVISTISFDHMESLGPTLQEIARHKVGIMREGVPAVVGYQPPQLWALIEEHAEEAGAPLYAHGMHWAVTETADGLTFEDAGGAMELPRSALMGAHQSLNAGLAIAALKRLADNGHFMLPSHAIAQGLAHVRHPARLTPVMRDAHPNDTHPIYFDGGHNVAAAGAMAAAFPQLKQEKTVLILGTSEGKDIRALLTPFEGEVEEVHCIPVAAEPLCYAPHILAEEAKQRGFTPQCHDSLEAALEACAQEKAANLLIFGSLFLWGEVS